MPDSGKCLALASKSTDKQLPSHLILSSTQGQREFIISAMATVLIRLWFRIMFGPAADVKAVYDAAGGQLFDEQNGFFSFPCNSPPAIAFNWGGQDWEISPENISLGETQSGSGQCVGALAAQDLGLGNGVWLLGDSFMKNVYTAFSFDDSAVGFAKLA